MVSKADQFEAACTSGVNWKYVCPFKEALSIDRTYDMLITVWTWPNNGSYGRNTFYMEGNYVTLLEHIYYTVGEGEESTYTALSRRRGEGGRSMESSRARSLLKHNLSPRQSH